MTYVKRSLLLVLSVCIAFSLSGCALIDTLGSIVGAEAIAQAEAIPRIAFGKEILSETSEQLIMTADEVKELEMTFSRYRGDMHYNTLSENEQAVYRAYEYSLENGYTYVYVDDLIISDYERLGEILKLLALDSPLLEQNLLYEFGGFTMYYDIQIIFSDQPATFDGHYIYVKNFDAVILEKKQQAIEKAEDILSDMPSDMTDTEKADYLHRYTLSNVDYYDYTELSDDLVKNYLYDGLITGKTHCDGSANMYSLLLNMADIECVEKQYTGNEVNIGHTWNFAKLDGVWYNIDATASLEGYDGNFELEQKRFFAFEDRMQRFTPDFEEIYPDVDSSLGMPIDAHMDKITGSDFVKTVKTAFSKNSNSRALILIDDYSDTTADKAVQKLADSLNTTVYWIIYEVMDNKTALVVYR